MVIGIDFDNTLVNTSQVAKKYLDIYKPGNTLKSYHELPEEEEILFFKKYAEDISRDLVLFDDAKETLDYFRSRGIKLVLITARSYKNLPQMAKDFLIKNNMEFDEEYFGYNLKGKICYQNGVDLMIDDSDKVLYDCRNAGIKVLKFGSKSDEFDYATSWTEIKKYVEEMIK